MRLMFTRCKEVFNGKKDFISCSLFLMVDIAIVVMVIMLVFNVLDTSNNSMYRRLFGSVKGANYLLLKTSSDDLILFDTKKEKGIDLELNADLVVSNEQSNTFYLMDFLTDRIEIREIKKFKDKIINSSNFQLKTEINENEISDFRFENGNLYLLNDTKKELINLSFNEQKEVSRLELPSDLINWFVWDDKVYLATNSKVYSTNAQNELKELIEIDNIKGISINNGILSVIEGSEPFHFLYSYQLEDLELVNAIAFESVNAQLLNSNSSEPHVYFSSQNSQGGLITQMIDLETDESYLLDLKLNEIDSNLHFKSGCGYYLDKNNEIVLHDTGNKTSNFNAGETIETIYPFY
ncbi:hypothetical protein [Turicibacter sp.]|uniref:hypothetical protein n=1 Tax=Turicibacter sp. TaxID=2049042 RepID=UPI001B4BE195|nr:hypothetical protein [Turicibacter sp.]MBP3904125.1 hypothetical protein [Turicibacter sp.]MBP3908542.1 hypothetical protein [Turicibacter sp.]